MGLREWFMRRTVKGMSSEEKESMMGKMMDEFFASMTSEEKKELMAKMMPEMMEKMLEGMTAEDRQELMGSLMPAMMSQMFGGEGGMPSMMMQMMRGMMGDGGEKGERPGVSVAEAQGEKPEEMMDTMSRMMDQGFASMSPEEMASTMHEVVPKMMESCFSKMDVEQRKGMLSMCRGILDDMEKRYS